MEAIFPHKDSPLAKFLQQALKRRGVLASIARKCGVQPNTVTDWKDGKYDVGSKYLPGIAEATKLKSIAELFGPVPQNDGATSPVTAGKLDDASTLKPGDALDAAEARVLRVRNDHLEKENVALRAAIKAITRIVTQAAARSAQDVQARPRGRR